MALELVEQPSSSVDVDFYIEEGFAVITIDGDCLAVLAKENCKIIQSRPCIRSRRALRYASIIENAAKRQLASIVALDLAVKQFA